MFTKIMHNWKLRDKRKSAKFCLAFVSIVRNHYLNDFIHVEWRTTFAKRKR